MGGCVALQLCYRSCMAILTLFFYTKVCKRNRCIYLKGFFKASKSRNVKLLVNSRCYTLPPSSFTCTPINKGKMIIYEITRGRFEYLLLLENLDISITSLDNLVWYVATITFKWTWWIVNDSFQLCTIVMSGCMFLCCSSSNITSIEFKLIYTVPWMASFFELQKEVDLPTFILCQKLHSHDHWQMPGALRLISVQYCWSCTVLFCLELKHWQNSKNISCVLLVFSLLTR